MGAFLVDLCLFVPAYRLGEARRRMPIATLFSMVLFPFSGTSSTNMSADGTCGQRCVVAICRGKRARTGIGGGRQQHCDYWRPWRWWRDRKSSPASCHLITDDMNGVYRRISMLLSESGVQCYGIWSPSPISVCWPFLCTCFPMWDVCITSVGHPVDEEASQLNQSLFELMCLVEFIKDLFINK